MYEPLREVYNSVLPENGSPAPPLQEWSGMSCICSHVFCRSFESTTNCFGFGLRNLAVSRERATGDPTSPASSFGLHPSTVTEGTHGSSVCLACGAHNTASPASASVLEPVETVAAPPCFANEVLFPSPIHSQVSSQQHTFDVAACGGVGTNSTAAVIPVVSLEAQILYDGGKPHGTGEGNTGFQPREQELVELRSETVDVDLLSGVFSEVQHKSRPDTTNDAAVSGSHPAAVVPVRDREWCDGGFVDVEVPN
ncbi:unnamed protein product, partial [Laminaria digitata]